MLCTRMTILAVILVSYFPLMGSDAISCPLHNLQTGGNIMMILYTFYNLKTLWNIIIILHNYVEQVMTMCRVQE